MMTRAKDAPSYPALNFFFDICWVVHHEFIPAGLTVNGKFYVQIVERFYAIDVCCRKCGQNNVGSCTTAEVTRPLKKRTSIVTTLFSIHTSEKQQLPASRLTRWIVYSAIRVLRKKNA